MPDLVSTVLHLLGIDSRRTVETPAGRPVRLIDGGAVISELV